MRTLVEFWEKLALVKKFSFLARSKSEKSPIWNRRGIGEVQVSKKGSTVLVFQEKGFWTAKRNQEISFTNASRWTLEQKSGVISLEHLRYGIENPVSLIHLAVSKERALSSIEPHFCGKDAYFCRLHFDGDSLRLTWRAFGPRKNEEIEYCYA